MKHTYLTIILSFWAAGAVAQGVPDTDIFLVPLKKQKETYQVGAPLNITQRPGYDNQPSFTPDGKSVLYASQRNGQPTDIYQYFLKEKKTSQLTATPEAEYSPLVMPDAQSFTVVRGKEQHLWRFPLKPAASSPALVLQMPQLIGYHVWYNQDSMLVAAFPETPPMSLYLAVPGKKEPVKLEESVGRCLQKVPRQQAISFLVPVSDAVADIKLIHLKTMERETLVQALPGSQDYAWTPDGQLLMAQGSKIFLFRPGAGGKWKEVADLSTKGIKNITRLAVSPTGKHLSFVATL
ncbi:PD40 domain-containing protein [Rufibacter glacialis]|uniref:PD40 domain-containing protein n=1 Tax=Rufibacter glacialis TaxID=1259555 RepID=A0A5M8QC67_9BACT|nr:PD40 domain-containing protein [Rufibacter glacialis]KAA6432554.1 hypothetical protein FOE74_15820 [Rufibacter glacialis]GGK79754.1 hypothetical protein GCM10011405_29440 [Rufibacter glacialis]